jgi:hypothetical protein
VLGADALVVIAERAVTLRCFQTAKDFCADAGALPGELVAARAFADEVSGEKDEVRVESVGLGDDVLEEPGFGELLEVDVADLDDAESDEWIGKVRDREGALHNL